MRISAKGRYALAAAVSMAESFGSGGHITVISISEKLGISKIYLEQVFSLLKRCGIVNSIKGAQGGYRLAKIPGEITVLDILSATELSLFEPSEDTVFAKAPEIEAAMRTTAFDPLDRALRETLGGITLHDLVTESQRQKAENGLMFYI